MNKNDIIDFEKLWDSGNKCRQSVSWKPGVKSFTLNQLERTLAMEKKLKDGTWKNGKPKPTKIYYPKPRDGLSIPYRDRIYQRSINDNVLYPTMVRSFIYDNAACQKGKGTDFARDRLALSLHNHAMKYGTDGWVMQIDIHGYYPSMKHDYIKSIFKEKLDYDIYNMVANILDDQYVGDVGYSPGSQMVQIAGISALNRIDHMCKEELHMKDYRRYMDDSLDISINKEKEEQCLERIINEYKKIGFSVNPNKTHVTPLKDGFYFLCYYWNVTESAKVIMTPDSRSVKHERKKLKRMANKVERGEMTREKADMCYTSWKSTVQKRKRRRRPYVASPNTYHVIKRMNEYYNNLWEE